MAGELSRALRSLVRRRTFAVTAVLTLALAFSIPAVVLSTVDRHFWRPLDLWPIRTGSSRCFTLATFGPFDFTLVAGGPPTRVNVALVSGNFFTVLGARPAHGRLLAARDDAPGALPAAVVSHRAWTTRFGRDPDLVGRSVRLGPQAFTVVGVGVNPLPGPAHAPDFWVPLSALRQLLPQTAEVLLDPRARWLETVGRLHASTSRGEAAELAALARDRLPSDVAAVRTEDWRFVARPVNHARLGPGYHRDTTRFLTVLVAITGVFLFAACSNMLLLLLTRGTERAHELAVRRALGASLAALVRPGAAELFLLTGAGVVVALLALRWVVPVVSALPQLAPLGPAVSLDAGVVVWMLAVAGAAWLAVCLGLLLMTAVRPPALADAPGPRATGRGRRQQALATAQVAVAGVLVVAAGLLLRSAHGVASISRGFVAQDVVLARIHPSGYSPAEESTFYRRLVDEIRSRGVVASAALGWHAPLSALHLSVAVEIPGTSMEVTGNIVSTGYFRTLGVSLLEGRVFGAADDADSAPVAIVNRTLAERLWPGNSGIGRVLTFPRSGGDRTVIGVVDDMRYRTLAESTQPLAYLPLAQRFMSPVFIHARSPLGCRIHVAAPASGRGRSRSEGASERRDHAARSGRRGARPLAGACVARRSSRRGHARVDDGRTSWRPDDGGRPADARTGDPCRARRPRGRGALDGARPGAAAGGRRGAAGAGRRRSADAGPGEPVVRGRRARRHDVGGQPGRIARGRRSGLRSAGAASGASRYRRRAAKRVTRRRLPSADQNAFDSFTDRENVLADAPGAITGQCPRPLRRAGNGRTDRRCRFRGPESRPGRRRARRSETRERPKPA